MRSAHSLSQEEKQDKVFRVFEKIAKGYDQANVRISLGMQDSWKRMLIRELVRSSARGRVVRVLDLCTGTGDIAIGISEAGAKDRPGRGHGSRKKDGTGARYQITGMDFSPSMLRVAARKAKRRGITNIRWRKGNAMKIPCGDETFDAVSISFGLRNCADPEEVLREIFRVLRPGGKVFCLESFVPDCAAVRPFYRLYFGRVMPLLGGGRSCRREYEWLQESTESFLRAQELAGVMERCGFRGVRVRRRMMGACALHTGSKPAR